ncbi:hypothetical protein SEPCBS57363_001134 [Sporothrix epigloea]|uniref:Uncharacterized protein n=1 Tax=Sporothrix epigloea TaxID=1892477 RepID=A0ABP0D9N3_9PEZI
MASQAVSTTSDNSRSGLTQAQLGGILAGVGGIVVLVLLFWYAVNHSEGYRLQSHKTDQQRAFQARQRYYRQYCQWNEANAPGNWANAVATSPPFVLNTPPLRIPPTVRQANYQQTAYPQTPGWRRVP